MPNLSHPDTGEHVRASIGTAERLIKEGWSLVVDGEPAAAPAAEPSVANTPEEPSTSEALPELPSKLGDLVTYAEEHQLFDVAQIEVWRKPGTKIADVKKAIEAKLNESDGR